MYLTWKLHNRHFHNANMNLWENWSWLLAPCIKWPNWNTMHIFNARQQTVTAFTLWLKLHFSVQNLYVETYMSKSKCVFWRPSWITFRNLFNSRQTVKKLLFKWVKFRMKRVQSPTELYLFNYERWSFCWNTVGILFGQSFQQKIWIRVSFF